MNANLIELFESSCEKFGDNMCIKFIDEDQTRTLTYNEVNCSIEEFCRSSSMNDATSEFVGIVADELNAEVVIIVLG